MTSSAAASIGETVAVTPLRMRNRSREADGFGLIAMNGWILTDPGGDLTLEVRFAGEERRLGEDEAIAPASADGSRLVEFHLLTHLVPDGSHSVEAAIITPSGERIEFPPFELVTDNDSALGRQVRKDLSAYGTPAILGRTIDSTLFPYATGEARAWFDRAGDDEVPMSLDPAADAPTAQRHLLRWGFCVLNEKLPDPLVDAFKQELATAIETGELAYQAGSNNRIHGAHQKLPSARAVWLYPAVLQFLEDYFRDTPCACQTLTYVNGSEQSAHQDSIHLTPYPSGFMCGVWVALEDVQENSGELFIYPGSHRSGSLRATPLGLGKVENDDYSHYTIFDRAIMNLVDTEHYERLVYRPKAGQILVWHENLIHGGSPRIDHARTRLSVVSHYFAKGSVAYYDSRGEAAALETLDRA